MRPAGPRIIGSRLAFPGRGREVIVAAWLAPGPGGGYCRSAPAGSCGVAVPAGGRYAEGFSFCEEFSSNTRKSLHGRKKLRNTGRASLAGLSGCGFRAVRGTTVVMTAGRSGGEMPVMAPGTL